MARFFTVLAIGLGVIGFLVGYGIRKDDRINRQVDKWKKAAS